MSEKSPSLTWTAKLGVGLVVGSVIPWLLLLALPFLPLSAAQTALVAGILVVLAEIMFWVGAFLAGKEAAQRYREQLRPTRIWAWIKAKSSNRSDE